MPVTPKITFIKGALNDIRGFLPDDADPAEMVHDAVVRARQMTSKAVVQVDAIWNAGKKASKKADAWTDNPAFRAYLGRDKLTKKQVKKMRRRLIHLNRWMGRTPKVKLRPADGKKSLACKKGRTGFNKRGKTGTRIINLCPKWFGMDGKWGVPGLDRRAAIIAHELAHSLGFLWTVDLPKSDPVRGPEEARRFAREHPKKARRNAENIEQFLMALVNPDHVTATD